MYPMKSEDKIDPTLLVDRQMYVINSRNLRVGAFDASTSSFYGIRTKFNSVYLDNEYEWDLSGSGTAHALAVIEGAVVPVDIKMLSRLYVVCAAELQVKNIAPRMTMPIHKHVSDDTSCEHGGTYWLENKALFDFIKPFDDKQKLTSTEF